jgi:hypothetical protein
LDRAVNSIYDRLATHVRLSTTIPTQPPLADMVKTREDRRVPLKVPIQGTINRSIPYNRVLVQKRIIDNFGKLLEIILEDPHGSDSGALPDDPSPFSRRGDYHGGVDCYVLSGYAQALCLAGLSRF